MAVAFPVFEIKSERYFRERNSLGDSYKSPVLLYPKGRTGLGMINNFLRGIFKENSIYK